MPEYNKLTDIRADPWGNMAPGWPEQAAPMAYRDAFPSHRRQGIFGEAFFFAAMASTLAVASAFAVDDQGEAFGAPEPRKFKQ